MCYNSIMKNNNITLINTNTYHSSSHIKYLCRYHVIFCPKYRRKVLINGIDERLKEVFQETAQKHDFQILDMEVMSDHVHLLIDCNPRYGIMQCITDLKWQSAHVLNDEFPEIRKKIPSIWTRSCFVATVGSVSLELVKQYIESQKGK